MSLLANKVDLERLGGVRRLTPKWQIVHHHHLQKYGNLLRGIDNCLGVALKGVGLFLTASFSNNFSSFEILQLFNYQLKV